VSRGKAMRQKSIEIATQMELALEGGGQTPKVQRSGEAGRATRGEERSGSDCSPRYHLMERVVERENAIKALKRVRRNKGSPGSDGMTVDELGPLALRIGTSFGS
jgi:hypothetical protein